MLYSNVHMFSWRWFPVDARSPTAVTREVLFVRRVWSNMGKGAVPADELSELATGVIFTIAPG